MKLSKKKRKYNSNARQEKSQETRLRVLKASRKLFLAKGLNKTTIEQIAKEAGVATPTVYALFRSKAGIIRELGETFVFGDKYKTLVAKSLSQENPIESLRLAPAITVSIFEMEMEQMGFLWDDSFISPDLQDLVVRLENQRYERQKFILERLKKKNLLPPEMTLSTARDTLWALTGRELFRKFVREKGWSHTSYIRWLEVSLVALLVNN